MHSRAGASLAVRRDMIGHVILFKTVLRRLERAKVLGVRTPTGRAFRVPRATTSGQRYAMQIREVLIGRIAQLPNPWAGQEEEAYATFGRFSHPLCLYVVPT